MAASSNPEPVTASSEIIRRARTWAAGLREIVHARQSVAESTVVALLRWMTVVSLLIGLALRLTEGSTGLSNPVFMLVVPLTFTLLEALFRWSARGPLVWYSTAVVLSGLGVFTAYRNGPIALIVGMCLVPFVHVLLPARHALWASLAILVGMPVAAILGGQSPAMFILVRAVGTGVILLLICRFSIRHVMLVNDGAMRLGAEVGEEISRLEREAAEAETARSEAARRDDVTGLLTLQGVRAMVAERSTGDEVWGQSAVIAIRLGKWEETASALPLGVQEEALATFGARLRLFAGDDAVVGRLGRTEYVVVWPDAGSNTLSGWPRVRQLYHSLREPVLFGERAIVTAPVVGMSRFPADGATFEDCLRRAEIARVIAQHAGVDAPSRYDPAMERQLVDRAQLMERIRLGITRGDFELWYQPIVPTAGGPARSAEALVRWRDGERGIVGPAEFLPLITSVELLAELSKWVFAQAARDVQRFRKEIDPTFRVAVNVSPELLGGWNATTASRFFEVTGVPHDAIIFELTESAFIELNHEVRRFLESVRARGVRIAIDDFGTGYSSLDRLETFPVDILKVDRAFVRRVGEGSRGSRVLRAIVQMGRDLGLTVVAEGVETEPQRQLLAELGCPSMQGFLYSPAVRADELVRLVVETPLASIG
jgi:EAL domain-containing protein (putative c-di-GMP-specific phosphodiesterase class I)